MFIFPVFASGFCKSQGTKDNLANSNQPRSCTDSTPNQTTPKQIDLAEIKKKTSTRQETLEGISVTDEQAAEVSKTKNWDATRQ